MKYLKILIGFEKIEPYLRCSMFKGFTYDDVISRRRVCVWLPLAPFVRLARAFYFFLRCAGIDLMKFYEEQFELRKGKK